MGYLSRKKADIVELAIKRREPSGAPVSPMAEGEHGPNVVPFGRFRK
jgi:hypothetical protein